MVRLCGDAIVWCCSREAACANSLGHVAHRMYTSWPAPRGCVWACLWLSWPEVYAGHTWLGCGRVCHEDIHHSSRISLKCWLLLWTAVVCFFRLLCLHNHSQNCEDVTAAPFAGCAAWFLRWWTAAMVLGAVSMFRDCEHATSTCCARLAAPERLVHVASVASFPPPSLPFGAVPCMYPAVDGVACLLTVRPVPRQC